MFFPLAFSYPYAYKVSYPESTTTEAKIVAKLNKKLLLSVINNAGYDLFAHVYRSNAPRCVSVKTVADLLSFIADLVEVAEDKYELSDVIRYLKSEKSGTETLYFWPSVKWEDA